VRSRRPRQKSNGPYRSVAQVGVEPTASLVLNEGGLPVAYRATCVIRRVVKDPESARRESNPPGRRGRAAPEPLGHGHVSRQRKERESNPQGLSLTPVRAGCRRQSACPSGCPSPPRNRSGQVSGDTWPRRGSLGVRVSAVERVRGPHEGPAGRPDRPRAAGIRLTDPHGIRSSGPRELTPLGVARWY
jgi:hypothetical protein